MHMYNDFMHASFCVLQPGIDQSLPEFNSRIQLDLSLLMFGFLRRSPWIAHWLLIVLRS